MLVILNLDRVLVASLLNTRRMGASYRSHIYLIWQFIYSNEVFEELKVNQTRTACSPKVLLFNRDSEYEHHLH